MKFRSCFSVIPQKREPKEQSELVNQLLFGEVFNVLEYSGNWVKIKTAQDKYTGYIDKLYMEHCTPDDGVLWNATQYESHEIQSHGCITCTEGAFHPNAKTPNAGVVVQQAKSWLGVPYLWGGKSRMGVDCSGFIQVLFRPFYRLYPRDAYQQMEVGTPISFNEIRSGDIVFFQKEGKIHHVGLAINYGHEIIHASGYVKRNRLTEKGIINDKNELTHHYAGARRLSFFLNE